MSIPVPGDALFAQRRPHPRDYLKFSSVPEMSPRTGPFDPGCDPSHSSRISTSSLKISMACWIVADENASRRKSAVAARRRVPVATGGRPFEIAVAQGQFAAYIDLCADIDVTRVAQRAVYRPDYSAAWKSRLSSARSLQERLPAIPAPIAKYDLMENAEELTLSRWSAAEGFASTGHTTTERD